MYPDRELIRLALHRKILVRRIARRRSECTAAVTQLARPFALLDRLVAFSRKLPSLAQFIVPSLGAVVAGRIFPRHKYLNLLVRWGPLVTRAVQVIRSTVPPSAAPRA